MGGLGHRVPRDEQPDPDDSDGKPPGKPGGVLEHHAQEHLEADVASDLEQPPLRGADTPRDGVGDGGQGREAQASEEQEDVTPPADSSADFFAYSLRVVGVGGGRRGLLGGVLSKPDGEGEPGNESPGLADASRGRGFGGRGDRVRPAFRRDGQVGPEAGAQGEPGEQDTNAKNVAPGDEIGHSILLSRELGR